MRVNVDKLFRPKSPFGKANQQKGVRRRMFDLIAK